ncbi:hypothetical protein H310_06903 [Aphanomyces invadans]|uniref:PH domain-containing protein n=1 Tax=Aphanomyces invadans TaxID=157072 RepID=A0A024U536_9STRA|nr:hypothetical protein H310_06903 [Aphanomyces invadans]ETW01345.1 hypothetical protein H310_06903 [Aphanomyces invadans]|eukprot:XP_008870343.1 hypothetical protein H310_06903 [Aphanomyces invadans]
MEDVDSSSSASNRSGRSGSLSRFMDKNGRNRRNSTTSSHSDCEGEAPSEFQSEVMTLIAMEDKRKAFQHLLNLEVEIIFDTLEETDSGLRTWLLQYDVVKEVLRVFSTPVLIHTPSNGVVLAPSIIAEPSIKEPLDEPAAAEEPYETSAQTSTTSLDDGSGASSDPLADEDEVSQSPADSIPPPLTPKVTTVSHEKAPLQAFVSAKVDEEYGYYKHVFVCSEIIMRVYTGEDDLYESFRMSSSSSGSAAVNEELTFGCQTQDELELWRLFFIYFTENDTIDEVQAAFYCKAFIRLHDAYCLEDGYVQVVLEAYVPALLKHLYMPTIKHLLLKLLQSYESIHPLTGVHDAMEAVAPLLIQAATLPVDLASPAVGNLLAARENACRLLVEMLQANQADRLGSFLRREDNQFLAKYFVRDQFGTIRGIEAVTEGYHNFLQFMLLEEFGKEPKLMDQLFAGSIEQLAQVPVWPSTIVAPCMLNIHVVSELLRIYCRYKRAAELNPKKAQSDGSDDLEDDEDGGHVAPPANGNPAVMYELSGLKEAETSLWPNMKKLARATTTAYVNHFFTQTNVPTSVDIAIAKHLYRLVTLQDPEVDSLLVQAGVLPKYLNLLQAKPDADMLLIHVVSALLFVITDKSQTRSGSCVLVRGIFGESIDLLQTIVDVYKKQHRSKAYFKVLNDTMLVMLVSECPSPSQAVVVERAIAHAAWHALNCETKRNLGLSDAVDAAASTAPVHETTEQSSAASCEVGDHPTDPPTEDQSKESGTPKPARRLSLPKSAYLRSVLSSPAASVMRNVNTVKTSSRRSLINIMNLTTTAPPETTATPNPSTKPNINNGSSSTLFGFGNSMLSKLKQRMTPTTPSQSMPSSPSESSGPKRPSMLPKKGSPDNQSLLVLDTSLGDDVTKCAVHDGGVHVTTKDNVVTTSGYMFKSGMPGVGKRHVWERYYFVLERGPDVSTLSYYISETQAKHRTLVKGVVVPTSVSEGIPIRVTGKHEVHAFHFNTQGHGIFWVLVDSKETKVTWLQELLSAITGIPFSPKSAHEILFPTGGEGRLSSKQMRAIVLGLYALLFGDDLEFNDPSRSPPLLTGDALCQYVHPNVVLSSNLPSTVPYWGEYHGFQGFLQFCKVREETVERLKGRVLRVVADEDESTVVVMTAVTLRIVHNSEVVLEESCDIVELTDGKISTIHLNFDSAQLSTSFQHPGLDAS